MFKTAFQIQNKLISNGLSDMLSLSTASKTGLYTDYSDWLKFKVNLVLGIQNTTGLSSDHHTNVSIFGRTFASQVRS